MKLRNTILPLALAALAAPAALLAQSANSAPEYSQYQTQPQAAPVERAAPSYNDAAPGQQPPAPRTLTTQPAQGIIVRSTTPVRTVSDTTAKVELRLNHGIANVTVHKPARGTLIQIDLPAGQTVLIHDGLYTFNADTSTVRVLHGKAEAYPGSNSGAKGITLKEDHQLTFGAHPQAEDLNLADIRNDILTNPDRGDHGYAGYPPRYGFAPYGYPYYAYDYPWGYPYGYGWGGYPYMGLGFGYYGGWGGGFYGGGFRGGGFHGGGSFHGGGGRR